MTFLPPKKNHSHGVNLNDQGPNLTPMNTQTRLEKDQKGTLAILSLGTFLEQFDTILYIQMGFIMNDIFFPGKSSFVVPFAFCSNYIFRPFGALFLGYLGDVIGRKTTIVLTTMMMSFCCIAVASLPTYHQIGIIAPIALTLLRMLQSVFAAAELNGVELYVMETVKRPMQYPMVGYISVFSALGGSAAIAISYLCSSKRLFSEQSLGYSWRFAFIFGALVGVIGAFARKGIREASEYADKKRVARELAKKAETKLVEPEVPLATSIAFFLIQCGKPPCMYFSAIYCGTILKEQFGFEPNEILRNNLLVSMVYVSGMFLYSYLSEKIHPFKILKFRLILLMILAPLFPLALKFYHTPLTVLLINCTVDLLMLLSVPANPVFFKHFPTLSRFRYTAFITALAKALTYALTSFGIVWIVEKFGYVGIAMVLLPTCVLFGIGLMYFDKKESALDMQSGDQIFKSPL